LKNLRKMRKPIKKLRNLLLKLRHPKKKLRKYRKNSEMPLVNPKRLLTTNLLMPR
jgi:50S ribosomal subunit-associated GTPase HflX